MCSCQNCYSQASNSWFRAISGTGARWMRWRANNRADLILKLLTWGQGRGRCFASVLWATEISQIIIKRTQLTFCNMPAHPSEQTHEPWVHFSPVGHPAAPAGWSKVCLTPPPGCPSPPLAFFQLIFSAVKHILSTSCIAWTHTDTQNETSRSVSLHKAIN